jgi:hypothetical protein
MMLHPALALAAVLATASDRPDGRPPKAPAGPPRPWSLPSLTGMAR